MPIVYKSKTIKRRCKLFFISLFSVSVPTSDVYETKLVLPSTKDIFTHVLLELFPLLFPRGIV